MKPVEIEFLVKDSTKQGAQRVSASVDRETLKVLAKMDRIQKKIDKLRSTNSDSLDQSENIAEVQKLEKQLDKLQSKMTKLSAKPLGPSADEIAATTRQYNGLNMSIQQMVRELPSLAIGPQTFFLAISNNLPMFSDNLARARKEYAALTQAGKSAIPVWKQVLSSIVSWQTALTAGIMLLVTYGKDIVDWVKNLWQGTKALTAAKIATEQFHSALAQGAVSAQEEITSLELLYRVATDTSRSYKERKHAISELKDVYPSYFADLSEEQIMLGNALTAYNKLRDAIYQVAQAKAAEGRLVEIAENEQLLKSVNSIEQYNILYKELNNSRQVYNEAQKRMRSSMGTSGFTKAAADAKRATMTYNQTLSELNDIQSKVFDELKKVEGGEDLLELINESYGGSLETYLTTQGKLRERLGKIAEQAYSQKDPTKDGEHKTVAKKKTTDLNKELLQAQRDAEDARLSIMKDGYVKRRMLAQMEFERQLHDIRANREKLLKEDKAETGGRNTGRINTIFDAQIYAVAEKYNDSLSKINTDESLEQQKVYQDLLQKYETYLQGRERLVKKYDKDIAMLTASPENQVMAEQAKEKALQEFDIAFANQFPQFEVWADNVVKLSVDKLRELIILAESALDDLENNVNVDPEAIAKTKVAIATLYQNLDEKQKGSNVQDGYERWQKLSEVLTRVNEDLQDVGDSLGGVAGDIIDVAGTVATSTIAIISGIKELVKTSAEGITTTSTTASTAIKGLERASVILTVVSAVLSIGQALAGIFKNTESSMERNLRLIDEFNEELRVINERARIDKSGDSIFGDAIYKNFRNNIDVMRDALRDLENDKKALIWRGDESSFGIRLNINPWTSIEDSIANMQVQIRHSTWFRSSKYASLKDLIPELFGDDGQINMDALEEFADESNNTFQKLSEDNKKMIQSFVADWETYEESLASVRDYLSSIFGDLGNTILDSITSVADGTMSASDAMVTRLEALSDTVREFAKNMIYSMTIAPLLEQAQLDIEKIYAGKGTDEEKYNAMLSRLSRVLSDVGDEQSVVMDLYNRFVTLAKQQGFDIRETTSQTAKAGAMYTVSQDSFTRAEGILTSIQAHVASGDLKLDNIAKQLGLQLEALNKIVTNTSPIADIYTLMLTIYRSGLKVL